MSKVKVIKIYTDGATPNNQNKGNRNGGYGVFFGDNDPRNISGFLKETKTEKVTNQVCELTACVQALVTIISSQKLNNHQVIICTDSMYIVNTINDWAKKWEVNGWRKADGKVVQNVELVSQLYYLSKNTGAKFVHVPAHKAAPSQDSDEYEDWYGNYMADKLAVQGAKG